VVHRTNLWLLWDWYHKDTLNLLIIRETESRVNWICKSFLLLFKELQI